MNIREEVPVRSSSSSGLPQDTRYVDRIEVEFRNTPESGAAAGSVGAYPQQQQPQHDRYEHKASAVSSDDAKRSRYSPPKLEIREQQVKEGKASRSRSVPLDQVQPPPPPQSKLSDPAATDLVSSVVEVPAEGTNEEHVKRRKKSSTSSAAGGETDFYRKPTMLSRLILNQKYGNAIRRVFNHPDEAKIWVCAKRARKQRSSLTGNNTTSTGTTTTGGVDKAPTTTTTATATTEEGAIYTIRQLPVHIACSSLSRTHDSHLSRLLNELISVLIFAFPDGAHEADHRLRLPIHDAIWYGAAPDTIALFLMAKPNAIHVLDSQGRTLSELNRYRNGSGKEPIQHLLNQELDFWIHARAEATTRLQHNNIRFPSQSETNTVSSVSVLASGTAEDDTILTTFSHQPPVEPDEIPPLSWDQLEKRLIASEQILATINERNFELTKQVEALTLIDQAKGAELVRELARMSEESALLNAKLHSIEHLCSKYFLTGDEAHDQPYQQALSEMSSLVGLSDTSMKSGSPTSQSPQPVLQVTKEAMAMHKALSTVHSRQRERIRKMRHIVEDLIIERKKSGDGDDDMQGHHEMGGSGGAGHDHDPNDDDDADSMGESAVSALTSHSARSHLVKTMARQASGHGNGIADPVMVDRTPPSSMRQQMDDLDAILRFAAAKDKARLCAGAGNDRRVSRMPQTDDLDAILQWATTRDESRLQQAQRRPSVSSNWSPEYAEHSPTKTGHSNTGGIGSPPQHVTPPQSNCASMDEDELALPALLSSTSERSDAAAGGGAGTAEERVERVGAQRSGLGWPQTKDMATLPSNEAPDETAVATTSVPHGPQTQQSDTVQLSTASTTDAADVDMEPSAVAAVASLPTAALKPPLYSTPLRKQSEPDVSKDSTTSTTAKDDDSKVAVAAAAPAPTPPSRPKAKERSSNEKNFFVI